MKKVLSIVALVAAFGGAIAGSRLEKNLYTLSILTGNIRECTKIDCTSLAGPAVPCPNPEVKYTDAQCTKVFTGVTRFTSIQ